MSTKEQQEIKSKAYSEAMRYMENAKETLQKARKEDNRFHEFNKLAVYFIYIY